MLEAIHFFAEYLPKIRQWYSSDKGFMAQDRPELKLETYSQDYPENHLLYLIPGLCIPFLCHLSPSQSSTNSIKPSLDLQTLLHILLTRSVAASTSPLLC